MKKAILLVSGAFLAFGCITFDAGPETRDLPPDDINDLEKNPDAGAGESPDQPFSGSLPPEVVAGLPLDLPQGFITGQNLGQDCDEDFPCRDGLVCEDDVCAAEGRTEEGDFCILSIECADGQCVNNRCQDWGDGGLGDGCLSSSECGEGLRCGVVILNAQCVAEGELGMGAQCESSNDCLSGLACVKLGSSTVATCAPVIGGPPGVPATWEGVACDEPSEDRVRAYFEIPGAPDADELDFFRLPFPNDVRTDDSGRVDVSDFPTPGKNPIVGVDPIEPYVDAVDGSLGWGTNSTVTFRFSGRINLDSLKAEGGIQWVDITDPEEPVKVGINYRTFSGRTNYVCHNVLSVRRIDGRPMDPGHTYAVWLSTNSTSDSGLALERSENFETMLSNSDPSNTVLAAAHEKFAPFRDYLSAQDIDTDDVLVATVITVGPVRDTMSELAQAVYETDIPTAREWILCDGDTPSPCPQAEGSRACGENDAYDEYQALVELPIFQRGEPPYIEEGGDIQTSQPVRTEEVCMALSIPKRESMPDGGWPLVVFTHGTGGSYRSHLNNTSVAQNLAAAKTPDGDVAFAVLGYDQVQHGPRRGDSEESPENLFFNFRNPDAAQGNPLQGAADVISIGRFGSSLNIDGDETGGDAIAIDPERVVYFGHSQGSMHGSLGLPYANEYKGAVLSGNGASLMHALLTKTQPVNIKSVVPLVVNDGITLDPSTGTISGELPDGIHNPVLSLIQHHIDPADPVNFGKQIAREPLEGMLPKHVFATYGAGDTYSPPKTMEIYGLAAQMVIVEPHSSYDDEAFATASDQFPLLASFGVDNVEYTLGIRQYGPPDGSDGHFVVFDVAAANDDALRFLGMSASGLTPQIGQ